MSAVDVLLSFAEAWDDDQRIVPGLTYGDVRELYRYICRLEAERLEALRSKEHLAAAEQWYAVRLQRLRQLAEEKGCLGEYAGIVANGTGGPYEPPTYSQQLNLLRWRLGVTERRYAELRERMEDPYFAARKWDGIAIIGGQAVRVRW